MIRKSMVIVVLAALSLLAAGVAWGVTATQTLTVNATVANTAKLTLSAASISFPDADPDTTPSISSTPASVTITAKAKTGASGAVTLTCKSGGDLTSGSDNIAISNVTWTGSGANYNPTGTMSKTADQAVAGWTGSGNYTGTNSYFLANSWGYTVGSYSATVTYTLTSP